MVRLWSILVLALIGTTYAATTINRSPTTANTTIGSQSVCRSCQNVEQFARKLVADGHYDDLREDLTKWCMGTGRGANIKVCSFLIKDVLTAVDRVASEYFCQRIKACDEESPFDFMTVNTDNTSCDFCLNVMNHVKAIVTAPETENEFKLAVANACQYLRSFQDECVNLIDENLDNVFAYLRQIMNPQEVCEQTGYCIKEYEQPRPRESFADIAGVINIGPVQQPPASQPENEDFIPFLDIERTATGLTLPPEEFQDPPTPSNPADENGGGLNCIICKQVAQWVIVKLKDNRTEEAIVDALDKVCDRILPAKSRPECETFVQQYSDEIISILKQENDPNLICALLGVCATRTRTTSITVTTTDNRTPKPGPLCTDCLRAAHWLAVQLNDSNTDDKIVAALDQLCKQTSGPLQELCDRYVHDRLADIIAAIRNGSAPAQWCQSLQLCPAAHYESRTDIVITEVEREQSGSAATTVSPLDASRRLTLFPTCFLCKRALHWINQQIGLNRTDAAIEASLDRVCPVFFRHKLDECQESVQRWSSEIIAVLRTGTSSAEIDCVLLEMCGMTRDQPVTEHGTPVSTGSAQAPNEIDGEREEDPRPMVAAPTVPAVSSDEACFECQSIAHFIQVELYDYQKEQAIDQWVIKNVCDKVVNVIAKQTCESFVEEYGASILQLIAMRAFDPKVLCEQELKLCPHNMSLPAVPAPPNNSISPAQSNPKVEFELLSPGRAELCDLCVEYVSRLAVVLTNDTADRDMSLVAARACNQFGGGRQLQCIKIIETFGPYFLQLIGRETNPREVCKAVDMCFIAGQPQLLGGHKCTFGPTYWCHTTAHAEACKATDFCTRQVWQPVSN